MRLLAIMSLFVSYAALANGRTTLQMYVDIMYQQDDVFRDLCTVHTGNVTLVQHMVDANQALKDCVNVHHNPKCFTRELDELTVERRATFFGFHCGTFEEIKNCYVPFELAMAKCLTAQDFIMAKDLIMLDKEFRYICENDGANVAVGQPTHYHQCGGSLHELLANCSDPVWHALRNKTIDTLTSVDCSSLSNISSCFVGKVKECGAPLFATLFDLRYQSVINHTGCQQLEEENSLPVARFSIP